MIRASKTALGKCRLCGEENTTLIQSHYLPAFIYQIINSIKEKGKSINLIQSNWIKRNMGDHQIKRYVLCEDCEILFNKNGETAFSKMAFSINKKNPKLFIRLIRDLLSPQINNRSLSLLKNIDNDGLYYFATSIFWRGAINWNANDYEKQTVSCQYSKNILDEMTDYLLNKKTPVSYKIIITPLLNKIYNSCALPKEVKLNDGGTYYSFSIFQYLFILIDNKLAHEKIGSVTNEKMIFCISEYFEGHFSSSFERSYNDSKSKGRKNIDVSWVSQKFTNGWSFPGSYHLLLFIGGNYLVTEINSSWDIAM